MLEFREAKWMLAIIIEASNHKGSAKFYPDSQRCFEISFQVPLATLTSADAVDVWVRHSLVAENLIRFNLGLVTSLTHNT